MDAEVKGEFYLVISYLHILETSALELVILHFPQIHFAVHNSFKNTTLCTQCFTVTKFPSILKYSNGLVDIYIKHRLHARVVMKNLTVPPSTDEKRQKVDGVCDKDAA